MSLGRANNVRFVQPESCSYEPDYWIAFEYSQTQATTRVTYAAQKKCFTMLAGRYSHHESHLQVVEQTQQESTLSTLIA